MTFILKDNIICVGKFDVKRKGTNKNKLYIIKPNGKRQFIATLKKEAFDIIANAIKKHWNYVDLSELEIDSIPTTISKWWNYEDLEI